VRLYELIEEMLDRVFSCHVGNVEIHGLRLGLVRLYVVEEVKWLE
jgi:hypothetical protein